MDDEEFLRRVYKVIFNEETAERRDELLLDVKMEVESDAATECMWELDEKSNI